MTAADSGLRARLGRAPFWLFAGHLVGVVSMAASNALVGLCWLAMPFARVRGSLGRGRPLLLPLALYLLFLVVSIACSYDPRRSLGASSDFFNLSTPLLALLLVRGEREVRLLFRGLVLLGAAVACHGVGQYLVGYDNVDQRMQGPFSHYMTFSGVLVLCDCLLLVWMIFGGGWRRPAAWGALVVIHWALLQSYTRNSWVALAVVLTVLAAVRAPRWLAAWVPATVVFLVLAPAGVRERAASITDLQDPSNYDRLCMTYAGLHMVAERPLVGLGPEMVRERYAIYRHPTAPRYRVGHLHSSYLNLAAERGLPALLAMLWLLAAGGAAALRGFVAEGGRKGPRSELHLGVMVALLAYLVMGFFEDYWHDTEVQRLVLFLLAAPFCLERAGPEEGAREPGSGES